MKNHSLPIKDEVIERLTEACDRQIKALCELLNLHHERFGPFSPERDGDTDALLRLRKVSCHVRAVVGWNIDRWAIHVMAPEIRYALEQLRHLTLGGMCTIAHEPGEECHVPRCFDRFDEELAPLTHPTSTVLALVPEAAGHEVRSLYKLCVLLHVLSGSYAGALDMEISRSDPNAAQILALAIAQHADSEDTLKLASEFLGNLE